MIPEIEICNIIRYLKYSKSVRNSNPFWVNICYTIVFWEFKLKAREYFFENLFAHMNLMVGGCFEGGGATVGWDWGA